MIYEKEEEENSIRLIYVIIKSTIYDFLITYNLILISTENHDGTRLRLNLMWVFMWHPAGNEINSASATGLAYSACQEKMN